MILETSTAKECILHRFNSNLRMYINKIDVDFPAHWHPEIEIIQPIVGGYKINCGSRTYILDEGDIIMICPAVLHEIFTTTPGGTRIYMQADFSKSVVLKEIESAFHDMTPALHIRKALCPPDIYKTLSNYIHDIQKIYFGSASMGELSEGQEVDRIMSFTALGPYDEVEIYSILMRFIALAGKHIVLFQQTVPAIHTTNHRSEISLSSVCAYIGEHFTEEISLDDIASYAGFSKYHFARIFNEYTGETFYQYLQQKRISFAQPLLSNPSLSITDVAYQAGFASSTAFTRAFKKSTGYTPSQFRMLNEKSHSPREIEQYAHFRNKN